jgi:hypothetical protein
MQGRGLMISLRVVQLVREGRCIPLPTAGGYEQHEQYKNSWSAGRQPRHFTAIFGEIPAKKLAHAFLSRGEKLRAFDDLGKHVCVCFRREVANERIGT